MNGQYDEISRSRIGVIKFELITSCILHSPGFKVHLGQNIDFFIGLFYKNIGFIGLFDIKL